MGIKGYADGAVLREKPAPVQTSTDSSISAEETADTSKKESVIYTKTGGIKKDIFPVI